jgi:hypothetical protein
MLLENNHGHTECNHCAGSYHQKVSSWRVQGVKVPRGIPTRLACKNMGNHAFILVNISAQNVSFKD